MLLALNIERPNAHQFVANMLTNKHNIFDIK